jgi:hypothetical protein
MYHDVDPVAGSPAADAPEQHHGDLRKGAYLKRRAAYQLQAAAPASAQAGADPRPHAPTPQAGEPIKD